MKKMISWGLCLTLTLGAFTAPAQAAALTVQQGKEALERNGGSHRPPPPRPGHGRPGPSRPGPGRPGGNYGGHRPPPPRGGYHHGNGGWVGFGVGAAIGTAIGAAIANTAPEPTMVFDPGCNCYYYR